MSDMRYGEASLNAREYFSNKVKNQLNKNATDYGLKFIKFTTAIPNWETYLTPKQREAAVIYLKTMNAYEVDHRLKLNNGTTHQRLFGSKSSKGAIGRLKEVYDMLDKSGYFTDQEKQKEAVQLENKKFKLTEDTLSKVHELFELIQSFPKYESYLSKKQYAAVTEFVRTRSFNVGAATVKVSVDAFQKILIGKKGALETLKAAKEANTINSWDEVN